MNILSHEDAIRAHALVAPFVVGQTTRYNNKRKDHRHIKWVIPYQVRLRRAIGAIKRAKIPFEVNETAWGNCTGFSIRVPLDFVAPADPHAAVKANQRNALADALALVLDLANENALDKRDAEANEQGEVFDQQQKALALVTKHLEAMKKAK